MSLYLLPEFRTFRIGVKPDIELGEYDAFRDLRAAHRMSTRGPWLITTSSFRYARLNSRPYAIVVGDYREALAQALCCSLFRDCDTGQLGTITRLRPKALNILPEYRLPDYMDPLPVLVSSRWTDQVTRLHRAHRSSTEGVWAIVPPGQSSPVTGGIVVGSYELAFRRATSFRPFFAPYNDRSGSVGKIILLKRSLFTGISGKSVAAVKKRRVLRELLGPA